MSILLHQPRSLIVCIFEMEIAKVEIDADIDIVVLPMNKPEIVVGGRNRVRI
jgi:hypothetical protein